jgi:hypothetical protein
VLANLVCASFPPIRLWKRMASVTALMPVPTLTPKDKGAVIKVVAASGG